MTFLQWFFLLLIFIPLILLWAFALVDLFRREDVNGGGKALWAFAIVLLPLVGMFIYFVTRPAITPKSEGSDDLVDQIERLEALRDKGTLSPEEFDQQKARLLGQGG